MTTEQKLQKRYTENLEKRVHNLEIAILGLWSIIEDSTPSEARLVADDMMAQFYQANTTLCNTLVVDEPLIFLKGDS